MFTQNRREITSHIFNICSLILPYQEKDKHWIFWGRADFHIDHLVADIHRLLGTTELWKIWVSAPDVKGRLRGLIHT